jgi:hypothetical protein
MMFSIGSLLHAAVKSYGCILQMNGSLAEVQALIARQADALCWQCCVAKGCHTVMNVLPLMLAAAVAPYDVGKLSSALLSFKGQPGAALEAGLLAMTEVNLGNHHGVIGQWVITRDWCVWQEQRCP